MVMDPPVGLRKSAVLRPPCFAPAHGRREWFAPRSGRGQ